jgi:hypothetical protein
MLLFLSQSTATSAPHEVKRGPHWIEFLGILVLCAAWFGKLHSHTSVSNCFPIFATFIDMGMTAAQYSATEYDRASVVVWSVFALAPHEEPANIWIRLFLVWTFLATYCRWALYVKVLSSVTPRYTGFASWDSLLFLTITASSCLLLAFDKWKTLDTVLVTLGW